MSSFDPTAGFKWYRSTGKVLIRPYIPGEDMTNIHVANGDVVSEGGAIVIDGDGDPDELYYIGKYAFENNYEMLCHDEH